MRQQGATGGSNMKWNQLAWRGVIADGVGRFHDVQEHGVRAARGGQHCRLAGALDKGAKQFAQMLGDRIRAFDLLQQREPERRGIVATAGARLI